jgi:hypothetical protein
LAIYSLHQVYKSENNVKVFCHLRAWLTLEPAPITQQSGQTPDHTTDNKEINHITVGGGDYTESDQLACCLCATALSAPSGCLCATALSAPTKKLRFEPTVWPDTCCNLPIVRILVQWTKLSDLARHLLQFTYRASFGAMDKTI